MNKFTKRTLIYIAIVLLYLTWGEVSLYKMRENIPLKKVVEQQFESENECYYSRRIFEEYVSSYKFEMLKKKKPDIQIIGQSIVLQFRDFLFKPYDKSFYNAGLMIRNMRDLELYFDLIEAGEIHKPKLIVLGIEHLIFKHNNKLNRRKPFNYEIEDEALKPKAHLRGIQQFLLKTGNVRYKGDIIGFGKQGVQGAGFRKDGSIHNKTEVMAFINDSVHLESDYAEALKKRYHPFNNPLTIDQTKVEQFYKILDKINDLNIELLVYVAPTSEEFYNIGFKDEEFYNYWNDFIKIQEYLIENNYNIIPFSKPSQLGLNDYYMVDAVHPGSVVTAIQFSEYMANNKHKFKSLQNLDLNQLNERIKKNTFPLTFLQDTLIQEIKDFRKKAK